MPDDVGALLDEIERWPNGVPVRLMQRVIAFGEAALPILVARIPDEDSEEMEPLWYFALLAELRLPAAIPTLIARLGTLEDTLLRVVATEALAKVGAAAVPALREVVAHGREETRLFAYGALGWITDEAAFTTLVDALKNDPPLAHVVAYALVDQHRPEVIPALFDAYQRCEPRQRADFAGAIQDLHRGVRRDEPVHTDWRLRYFIAGSKVGVDVGWIGVCSILHEDPEQLAPEEYPALLPLTDIVGGAAEDPNPAEYCEDCGALVEAPTGVPICPENALDVVRMQLSFFQEEREAGLDDIFDIMNEVDMELWDLIHQPEPSSAKKRAAQEEQQDYLVFLRDTCTWSLARGLETVGPARATLLAEIGRLADRYGIEAGGTPRTPLVRTEGKPGRNDPCSCGSGKKYKNCCLK